MDIQLDKSKFSKSVSEKLRRVFLIAMLLGGGAVPLAQQLKADDLRGANRVDSGVDSSIDLSESSKDSSDSHHDSAESSADSAQNSEAVYIGESVISASGYEQDIKDAPASISIIPKEEIMTRPIRDLGDAVQDVPGVSVEMQKTGGNTISMRGLGSAYTLILIDGKRQNVAQGFSTNGFGEALNANIPPLSMIERIEVIRGPASTIYGSDAMGGVINIITKKHTDKTQGGMQLDARFSENPNVFGNIYGANAYVTTPLLKNMLSLNLRGGYKIGEQNTFLKPAGLANGTGGTNSYANPYATHSATGFTNWNAGLRLNYTPESHNSLYFDAEAYFARVGSLNTSRNQITGIRDFYKVNSVLNHDANYDWGKINTYVQYSATLWASHYGYTANTSTPSTSASVAVGASKGAGVNWGAASINQDVVFQSAYNNSFDLGWAGAIIFNGGVYYLYENLWRKSNATRMDMHQVALFGEAEYLINEYISTTLGLRLNYSDKFNSLAVPNPRFYVNVNPTNYLTFKAGISSGVLAPQLSYLYDGWNMTANNTGILGNKNIQPEKSWNYELSGILDFEAVNLTLTGYYTDFRDKISTQPYTDATCTELSTCSIVRNVDKSLITGAEASFKLKPIYYGIGLDMSYSFAYTEILSAASQGTSAEYYKGEPLNLIPRHSFVIKPSYKIGGFEAFLRWSGKFQTPTPTPAPNNSTAGNNLVRGAIGKYYKNYQILDLSFSYKFSNGLGATFAVNNLLNTNFWEPILFNNNQSYTNQYQRILPSRSYWLTLRYDF